MGFVQTYIARFLTGVAIGSATLVPSYAYAGCDDLAGVLAGIISKSTWDPTSGGLPINKLLRLYKNDNRFYFWMLQQDPNWMKGTLWSPEHLIEAWERAEPDFKTPWAAHSRAFDLSYAAEPAPAQMPFSAFPNALMPEGIPISKYDATVIQLRSGDTVRFSGGYQINLGEGKGIQVESSERKFTLGRFLGRGNATHIYELEGHPDEVLRLPFAAGFLAPPLKGITNRVRIVRDFVETYIKDWKMLKNKGVNIVDIRAYDTDYRYVVVSKITGTLTGEDYIDSLDPPPHIHLGIGVVDPEVSASKIRDPEQRRRFIELYEQCKLMDDPHMKTARQFVWDEGKSKWILADWE